MSKYGTRKKQADFIISEEVAIGQVDELLEYYDIDIEALTDGDGKEAKAQAAALEKALDHICRSFRTGTLSIERSTDGKMTVTQTLKGGESLTYGEISARAKVAMEKFSAEAGYSRIYAFMGSLSGVGKAGIEKLGPNDLAIVEVLGTVFSNA